MFHMTRFGVCVCMFMCVCICVCMYVCLCVSVCVGHVWSNALQCSAVQCGAVKDRYGLVLVMHVVVCCCVVLRVLLCVCVSVLCATCPVYWHYRKFKNVSYRISSYLLFHSVQICSFSNPCPVLPPPCAPMPLCFDPSVAHHVLQPFYGTAHRLVTIRLHLIDHLSTHHLGPISRPLGYS